MFAVASRFRTHRAAARRAAALIAVALAGAAATAVAPAARADTPQGPIAYVGSNGGMEGGGISVIDADSGTVTATLLDGAGISDVELNPAETRLYAADDNNLIVIDTATETTVATIPLSDTAFGLAVNPAGTRAYASTFDGKLAVIDTATNSVTATISGVAGGHLAISPDGSRLYAIGSGAVNVLDTASNTLIASIPVARPFGVAVSPSGSVLYVTSDTFDGSGNELGLVDVINTGTNAVTASIQVGLAPEGVAFTPSGAYAYTANYDDNSVSVIDTSTNTVTRTIATGLSPAAVAFNAAGSVAYVVNLNDLNVVAIDTGTATITTTTAAPIYPNSIAVTQVAQPTTTGLAVSPAGPVTAGTPVTLTATIAPSTAGTVQFYDGATPLGSPVNVTTNTAQLVTSTLIPGTHSLAAAFTPSATNSLPSTSPPVNLQANPPGIAIDQVITATGKGTVTTAPITTSGARLFVAYVSSDGPTTKQTTTVTGAGLTWSLAARGNKTGNGTAEIWTALAPTALSGVTVTSTPKAGGYDQSLTVVAYSSASGIGATATAGKAKGAPTIAPTTTRANAWVFAVGEDYSAAVPRTLGSGQSLVSQWVDSGPGETFWVQGLNAPTPTAGTVVTLNDTAPTADTWNMAAVEILP